MVSIIIPAYNEERRIGQVIKSVQQFADEIIVIDDGSYDKTVAVAQAYGAQVIQQSHSGYIEAIKRGFRESTQAIIVTIDADGEHPAHYIPQLIGPIINDEADLVLGARRQPARISEYLLTWLTRLKIKISDSCTGFRAIKRQLAIKLELVGNCTCGIFVLEALSFGARIIEITIDTDSISKKRQIARGHFKQMFFVISWLCKLNKNEKPI